VRAKSDTEAALPDWLREPTATEYKTESAPAAETKQLEPAPVPETTQFAPEPAPEKPLDALTLISNARDRRATGDLKGALDMYERAMHRRPNHLDEIIKDLQEVVSMPNAPSSANRMLGEAFAMAGRFKESLEQYRIAMGK
jgi:hypothetical protein